VDLARGAKVVLMHSSLQENPRPSLHLLTSCRTRREQAYAPMRSASGVLKGNVPPECEFKIAQTSSGVRASLSGRLDCCSLLYSLARRHILLCYLKGGGSQNVPVLFRARKRRRRFSRVHLASRFTAGCAWNSSSPFFPITPITFNSRTTGE
jgi:hypothetical protein